MFQVGDFIVLVLDLALFPVRLPLQSLDNQRFQIRESRIHGTRHWVIEEIQDGPHERRKPESTNRFNLSECVCLSKILIVVRRDFWGGVGARRVEGAVELIEVWVTK